MTSERAQAYGRVMRTLEDLAAAKLLAGEQEQIRTAADTLLFSEGSQAPGAREALDDITSLIEHLTDSGRWTDERAQALAADLMACGSLTPVA